MAGLYSRTNYDSCAYDSALNQSTKPLNYQLNNFCNSLPTSIKNQGVHSNSDPNHAINTFNGDLSKLVEVEHTLQGVDRIRTKCPDKQFPNNDKLCLQNKFKESKYTEQSSRLTNPLYNYRGMTINRFINLGVRPISNCQNYGDNTRQSAKDAYKARNSN